MTYATQMQIQIAAGGYNKLLELTDQESTNSINAAVLAEAQAKADAWMHSLIRMRLAVPVQNLTTEGAATMARLEADETVYQLIYASPMRVIGENDAARRKLRQDELEAIASGKMRIDDPSPAASTAVPAGIFVHDGPNSRRGWRGTW